MAQDRCGGFTYEAYAPPGPMGTSVFEFLSPGWLMFERPTGQVETINYGITDRVEILQPSLRYAASSNKKLDMIPCPDGSMIIDWSSDLHLRWLHSGMQYYKDIGL